MKVEIPEHLMLSKSSFMSYLKCPYAFRRTNIDGFRTPPSEAQLKGTHMHEQIENFYVGCKVDKSFSTRLMSKESIDYLKLYLQAEKKRYDKLNRLDKLKYFFPAFTEEKVAYPAMRIKGTIDHLFPLAEEDSFKLIEIKTGNHYPQWALDVRVELEFYAFLIKKSSKLDVPLVHVNFVKDNIQYYWNARMSVEDKINEVWSKIRDGQFNPTPHMWCRYCPFVTECGEHVQ